MITPLSDEAIEKVTGTRFPRDNGYVLEHLSFPVSVKQMKAIAQEAQRDTLRQVMEWVRDNASLEEYKDGGKWCKDGWLLDYDEWEAFKEENIGA